MKITRDGITGTLEEYLSNLVTRGFLKLALALPYRARVVFMGWLLAYVIGPIAGYTRRVRSNLAFVAPEIGPREAQKLARAVCNNAGRTLIEIYSGQEFVARMKNVRFEGDGVETLFAARDAGKPVVLVTGHFGNYDVPRGVLTARGYPLAALYNPLSNPFFNRHYVNAISTIGTPVVSRQDKGVGQILRHLSGGGMVGVLFDLHVPRAPYIDFFGKPARTPLSVAQMALKHDALLIPIYSIRDKNGLDFTVRVDAPIAHSDPVTMMTQLNDGLEALTRAHMEQWFWIHRRWKPGKYPPEVKQALAQRAAKGATGET